MNRYFLFCLFIFNFALCSCSKDTLPKFYYLNDLRVIDLNLDQPEVSFDGLSFTPSSVQLTPWIADRNGAGRVILESVYWCLDPGVGAGAIPSCAGNPSFTSVLNQQSVSLTSSFLAPNYIGALAPVSLNLSSLSSAAQLALSQFYSIEDPAQKYNGYSLLVFFEMTVPSDPSIKVKSFKRLVFSDSAKVAKNKNPVGLQVQLSGVEITALNQKQSEALIAVASDTSIENYALLNSSSNLQNFQEKIDFNWFLSDALDGDLTTQVSSRGETNTFTPSGATPSSTRGRILVVVARDGRGGSQVKRYCDGVCP